MAGVDARAYTDLILDDRTAQDLVRVAVQQLAIALPDIVLREGHTESVLIEAVGQMVSETIYALNQAPAAATETLLRLYGLTRDAGAPAVGTVRFAMAGGYRVEAPAGVRLRLDLGGGLPAVALITDAGFVAETGTLTVDVAVTADRNTADPNATPPGTGLTLLTSIAGVEQVTVQTALTAGRDPETSRLFLDRGVARLARLVETLVLPEHFSAAALEDPRVARAFTVDVFNADAGSGTPGSHPGHVTVALLGPDAQPLSTGVRAEIAATLAAQTQANLAVHTADPTVTTVAVAVTVRARPGYTNTQITAAVQAAVASALNPLTWPWETTVYRFALVGDIDQVPGVARVEQVLLNGVEADVTLPGVAPLAKSGVVTVSINQ